jgi:hypothetical protein
LNKIIYGIFQNFEVKNSLNRAGVKPAKFIISEFSNYNERLVAKYGQGGGDGGLVYIVFTIHNNENDDK